jgi:hypothetical protein
MCDKIRTRIKVRDNERAQARKTVEFQRNTNITHVFLLIEKAALEGLKL